MWKPTPLYRAWVGMRQRCRNPKHSKWKHYGGRGITICPQWESFAQFAADMGPKPPGKSLDRIDNDGNYEPSNCRWATQKVQMRNRRITVRVTIEGATYLVCDLSAQSGLKPDTIIERAAANLGLAEVLSPKRRVYREGLALGGRASGAKKREKGRCIHGHEFTPENTRHYRGARVCRRCKADREAAARAAGKRPPRGSWNAGIG